MILRPRARAASVAFLPLLSPRCRRRHRVESKRRACFTLLRLYDGACLQDAVVVHAACAQFCAARLRMV